MPVECTFDDSWNSNIEVNISTSNVFAPGTQGRGSFAFDAAFYIDETFTNKSEKTDIIIPGENVFYGIKSSKAIQGVSFYVDHCSVNDDFGNSFSIVEESCGASSINTKINNFLSEEFLTLQYTAFLFNSKYFKKKILKWFVLFLDARSDQDLKVKCKIFVCVVEQCPEEPDC